MSIAEPMTETTAFPSGFEALYADHYDFLWRCALRLGASNANAEDLVHEAFVVALRRYDRTDFEGPGAARPSTWLFAILHNVLRNHARSERRRQARLELLASESPPRPMQIEVGLGLRLLDEFLSELEPDRRVVFVLSELEGMRGPEIARALGVNPNTVRSRLRAAREAFEERFGRDGEQLVERASDVQAPQEARARGLALLGLPLAAPIATMGSLGWVIGVVIGALVLIGAAVVAGGGPSRAPAAASFEPPAQMVGFPTVPGSVSSPLVEPPEEPIIVEAREPAARTQQRPTTQPSDPDAEARERLARARRALLDGDAAAALALVEATDGWPEQLDAHRVALEIGALCALNRPQQAHARALAWDRAHPDTSTAIALQVPCWHDNSSAVGGHREG